MTMKSYQDPLGEKRVREVLRDLLGGEMYQHLSYLASAEKLSAEDKAFQILRGWILDRGGSTPHKRDTRAVKDCLVPTCANAATSRGVCALHYTIMRYYVKRGCITWGWLEKNRRILPSHGKETMEPAFQPIPPKRRIRGDDIRWIFGLISAENARTPLVGPNGRRRDELSEEEMAPLVETPSFLIRVARADVGDPPEPLLIQGWL